MNIEAIINQNPGLFAIMIIWTLIWNGFALWKSAREGEKGWFFSILILNTLGILAIIYLLIVKKYFKNIKNNKNIFNIKK